MALGLLVLRLALGLLLFGHATQKLFGWFSGHGIKGTAPLFENWGFRPGPGFVALAAVLELVAAVLLVLGLFTPVGAACAIGTMVMAAYVTSAKGLWAVGGGCELPLTYALMAVALALTGPGAYSLDAALGVTGLYTPITAAIAIVGPLVLAVACVAYINAHRPASAPAGAAPNSAAKGTS